MLNKLLSLFQKQTPERESELDFYISNPETHNLAYQKGVQLISPHIWLDGRKRKLTPQSSKELLCGIKYLAAVTTYNPSNWNAHWIIGKAYQALGKNEAAYHSFKSAYQYETANPNVAREFGDVCLRLGRGEEAAGLAIAAVQASPEDAGLRANLALAYLIAGNISSAQEAIGQAIQMDPADAISRRVAKIITEVAEGRRPQPKMLSDLEK